MPRSIVERISIQTTGDTMLLTFTNRVGEIGRESRTVNVPVFGNTLHTTTELTVNEDLEDLDDDLLESVRELVPVARLYCSRK
jgi:thiamine phosphate synthase YjbQ (UPF0047 family)